jgi:hypothetical protein
VDGPVENAQAAPDTMRLVSSVSQFDLLAASLRADLGDQKAFVEALATKLTESFPDRVQVDRRGGGLLGRGVKRVERVSVRLGDNEYELAHEQGRAVTRRRNVVRGVALKTEELPMEAWIDELSSKLVDEAGRSERDRLALEKLLND